MKKQILLLCLSFVLILSACATAESNKLTIPELTDREKQILATSSNQGFVFDYSADQTYTSISMWLDKYEKGKKTAEPINLLSIPLPGKSTKGTMILTLTEINDQQLLFSTSISDTNGSVGTHVQDAKPGGENLAMLWGTNPKENLSLSEEMLPASIIYTDSTEGVSTSSLSSDFYEKMEDHMDELKEYDVVYLLRASFKK
ncbi:hypothetical protein [Sporosarcina obsidiansis]|uniref:hypothetical protein n=1 Tax=Sporosarcina obsidiansis TaxID=2660748 RepID=UPI00129B4EE8|nr:hypothetical protein [Sporosarcina obsidiansis]